MLKFLRLITIFFLFSTLSWGTDPDDCVKKVMHVVHPEQSGFAQKYQVILDACKNEFKKRLNQLKNKIASKTKKNTPKVSKKDGIAHDLIPFREETEMEHAKKHLSDFKNEIDAEFKKLEDQNVIEAEIKRIQGKTGRPVDKNKIKELLYIQRAEKFAVSTESDIETIFFTTKRKTDGKEVTVYYRYRAKTDEFLVAHQIEKDNPIIVTYYKPDPKVHGLGTNKEFFQFQIEKSIEKAKEAGIPIPPPIEP